MKSPKHLQQFITGSAFVLLGNFIIGFLNYFTRRAMAEQLSVVDYGSFYAAFSLFAIITSFLDMGLGHAGTVFVAEQKERIRETFSLLFLLKSFIGISFGCFIFIFRKSIALHYLSGDVSDMIGLFGLYVCLVTINSVFHAYFFGKKLFAANSIFLCSISATILIGASLLIPRYQLSGAVSAYCIAYALFIPIQLIYVFRHGHFFLSARIGGDLSYKLLSLIGVLAIISSIRTILFYIDSVMLTKMQGAEATAVYNIALPVTQLVLSLLALSSVFLPIAIDFAKNKEYSRLKVYVHWAAVCTFLMMPFFVFFSICWGNFLIRIMFKASYVDSASVLLPYLLVGYLFANLAFFITQIFIAVKKMKILLATSLFVVALNITLNYIFISWYGVKGAAIATMVSYFVYSAVLYIAILLYLKHNGENNG